LVGNEKKNFPLDLSWTDCWCFGGRCLFASCLSGSCTRSAGRWWQWRCRRRGRCSVTALQTSFWCTGKMGQNNYYISYDVDCGDQNKNKDVLSQVLKIDNLCNKN